jgi:hypothetical protein
MYSKFHLLRKGYYDYSKKKRFGDKILFDAGFCTIWPGNKHVGPICNILDRPPFSESRLEWVFSQSGFTEKF